MIVVGAALIRVDRVLAARRSAPSALAGGWEFPGGKLESGEAPADAVARECREELGVDVQALREVGVVASADIELHLWTVRLVAGEPSARQDHDELRWLGLDELDTVEWLPLDRDLLPAVRLLLR